MSKKIRLTWMDDDFKHIEECLLVSDTDQVYLKTQNPNFGPDLNNELVSEAVDFLDAVAKSGMVLFEDEEGIFCVHSSQIVEIEEC